MSDAQKKTNEDPKIDPATAEKLKAAADKKAEQIMASDEGANTESSVLLSALDTDTKAQDKAVRKQEEAFAKLRQIAVSYQRQSPDSHIIFGAAGIKYTLGDLRDLFQLPR